MISKFDNEKFKIVVYKKIDEDIDELFLSDEHFYSSSRATWSAFDNWFSDDATYDFDRWYGDGVWFIDCPDDDTKILYVDAVPRQVIKLIHIYGSHTFE